MLGARGSARRWWAPIPLLLLTACAGTVPGPETRPPAEAAEPWEIAPGAVPTQRLYRVKYRAPDTEVGFKLTLYLEAAGRYRMQAADALGRKLWSLDLDTASRALWLDHRRKEYCVSGAADRLTFVPLAHLPLEALPKLLLGRLPAVPAEGLRRTTGGLSYLDARGQRWRGSLAAGDVEHWSLVEAGEAVAWWRREEAGGRFTDRQGKLEVSWRQVVREPLKTPLSPLSPPARYRERPCVVAAAEP